VRISKRTVKIIVWGSIAVYSSVIFMMHKGTEPLHWAIGVGLIIAISIYDRRKEKSDK